MEYSEKWGKDVEEAVSLALKDLKLSEAEVEVEVLEEPAKGFLGLGSKLAKVRVFPKGKKPEGFEEKENKQDEVKPVKAAENLPRGPIRKEEVTQACLPNRQEETEQRTERREDRREKRDRAPREDRRREPRVNDSIDDYSAPLANERPENLVATTDHPAVQFIVETFKNMDLDLTVTAEANDEAIFIDIQGDKTGLIIGKRGQTLEALQYLTSLVANRGKDDYIRIVLDAENYREKREKTLRQLASRLADKAARYGRPVKLEPMNPYERMIIHAELHDNDRVRTRSQGEEPNRYIIVERAR
ncbi:MAG: RNA-binding cell elongation regulator Jag/EloR [Anaerovoracaceae bacterium]